MTGNGGKSARVAPLDFFSKTYCIFRYDLI